MNHLVKRLPFLISILGCIPGVLQATTTQFRSPLMLERGPIHYQLPYLPHVWWFDDVPSNRQEGCMEKWFVNNWTALYGRTATRSFFKAPCGTDVDTCKSNSVTRELTSLSQLFFGADSFTVADTLANATVPTNQANVLLGTAQITPRFSYNEYGVYLGLQAERTVGCNNDWYVGGRASMPIEVIDMLFDQGCKLVESPDDVLNNVVRFQQIDINSSQANPDLTDYAVRFDFLNLLTVPTGGTLTAPTNDPFVILSINNISGIAQQTQIYAGKTVSGNAPSNGLGVALVTTVDGLPPVYSPTTGTFRKDLDASGVVALSASGALAPGEVAYFKTGTDYASGLGSSLAAQRALYVVPTLDDSADELSLSDNSQAIYTQLKKTLQDGVLTSAITPVSFFEQCCTNFCGAERITGQGDIDAEIYGGYRPCDFFYTDIFLGMRLPTGKRQKDARRPYYQTTGHNGHFQIKVGMDLAMRACRYFGIKTDWSYNHAFNRTEHRNAPFVGSLVRNIGPQVDAKVSWNYWTFHFDLNFFHPHNPEIGGVFGYELFAKQNDKVCLDCATATDCLGQTKPLDATLLETNTNAMTHKLRGEVYHRWNYFEFSLGASQVLAGRNAMKESEAYVAATLHF